MKGKFFLSATLMLPATLSTGVAVAQSRPMDDGTDIVVTAQKREQKIQDVGLAIAALDQQALRTIDVNDATQLALAAPSLQVQQYSPSVTIYNIRGVSQNDYQDFQEGPIAFYNDEVYVSALGAIANQTFDVERVEILRGPQGTLFGRNATGGLVQVVTAKPTATWQGFGTVTVGSYKQVSTEFGIGGPLTTGVRMRLSGATNYNEGYYRNIGPAGGRGGESRNFAVRGQLEFDVGARGLLRLKAEYIRNDAEDASAVNGRAAGFNSDGLGVILGPNQDFYGTCPGCTAVFVPPATTFASGNNPYVNNLDLPGLFDRTYYSLTARYEHELSDAITLTSITNYQDLNKHFVQDVDATPFQLISVDSLQNLYQISQELRLSSTGDRFNWTAGVYGLRIKTDVFSDNVVIPAVAERAFGLPTGTFISYLKSLVRQKTDSFAAFAQADYKLSDIFTIVVGGRYSVDWKDYTFSANQTSIAGVVGPVTYNYGDTRPSAGCSPLNPALLIDPRACRNPNGANSRTFENWSGKIQLEARPTADTLLYVGINRGTKGGGFNGPRNIPSPFQFQPYASYDQALAGLDAQMSYGQEELTNYEAGFKMSLLDRHLTINGAAFHYDYKGYQAYLNNNNNVTVVNQPAKISGAELEVILRPSRILTISGFATHLFEAKVEDVLLPGTAAYAFGPSPFPGLPAGALPRVVNQRVPNTPKWSVGGTIGLDVPIGDNDRLGLSTTWKYDSSQSFAVYNAPSVQERGRAIGNVLARYNTGPIEITAFVNNITDKRYRVFAADNSAFVSITEETWARPRWFGGSLTYRIGQ